MAGKLVIVESPAKAKTIGKFLGKEYKVASCFGHIRDLPESGLAINIEKNYEPEYVISDDKKDVVKELKKLAKNADEILLATDEDREGEAISWHLCEVLGIKPSEAKRVTYTEITEKAVKHAVKHPRKLNMDLVNAQQARRVLDRLVGYEISPVLWRKVKPQLSAGRVQSVAVRLIVEREREIRAFQPVASYKIIAHFTVTDPSGKKVTFKAERPVNFKTENEALNFLEEVKDAVFTVSAIEKRPGKRTPAAPFTTSTLQQEASRKLGFPVAKTMLVAQRLYENGHITYMRTDSTTLSDFALEAIEKEVKKRYGKEFYQKRQYATKNENAQEAHEAIRPSYIDQVSIEGDADDQRLYELIWKRTVASQMADAEIEKTVIDISNNKNSEVLRAQAEVVLFEGFLKVYNESVDEESEADEGAEVMIPPVKNGQQLPLKEMVAIERFTKPAPRYTEASLVKKLEELGIGRPSTYAPTISTIQKRNYVVKESREGVERKYKVFTLCDKKITSEIKTEITGAEKHKLFPTDIGLLVTDFLMENFRDIMDYNFTAEVEKEFDEVALGKMKWYKMIDNFYKPFHQVVETTTKEAQRVSGERLLGEDPASGEPVIARMGRYGPMVQIGKSEESSDKKPRFARLKAGQSIETITLQEALDLFKLPRVLGYDDAGKEVKVNIGRFGPYVQVDKTFASIPKDKDPYTITLEDALTLIREKEDINANRVIHNFEKEGIQVLNGRYGPYIKKGNNNYKIPKDKQAEYLTLEDVLMIIGEQGPTNKGGKRFFKRKR
ncbi:MAG: type I DNA topoisomerase [Chitinophagales bacterium]|nr:type I DNA topoisomerase [Chitinophagales bacterium]MDW8418060.1 type I DNA topoisomerase [Chitinophagales bacterium]